MGLPWDKTGCDNIQLAESSGWAEAAHGMLDSSALRAVERLKAIRHAWPLPKFFSPDKVAS